MGTEILTRVIQKISKNGPAWALARTKKEFKSPTFRTTKRLMAAIYAARRWCLGGFLREDKSHGKDYLIAIYDLNSNPITFDFAYFLIGAELFAKKNGKHLFVVWIVQRNSDSTENAVYDVSVDANSTEWRFANVVLPLINLCPACIGHSVIPECSSISELIKGNLVYPEFYDGRYTPCMDYREIYQMARQEKFVGLCSSIQGNKYIQSWKKANNLIGRIVTITIRKYGYDTSRNSNIDEWAKFAALIKTEGFVPVFIPDTDSCFEQDQRLDDFIVFREPCWSLGLRMALYEQAFVNFFVSSGPAALAQLNVNISYVCMKAIVTNSLQATEDIFTDRGISVGQRRYDFAQPYQILSWSEDLFENIQYEFIGFLEAKSESISRHQ